MRGTPSQRGTAARSALLVSFAIAVAIVLWLRWGDSDERGEAAPRPDAPVEATQPRVEPSGQAPPERERLATEAPAVEVPEKTGRPTSFPARGIVRDVRDLPIAGVGIGTAVDEKAGTVRVRSGADGSFAVDLPRYIATLIAIDPEWATLRASRFSLSLASL